ncbi:MAG: hypothetical protein NC086_10600 [Alistipes sp.]|nr:hypothetical protein [Alistipes sp.]
MKKRIVFAITVCVVLAAAVFGMVRKKSYTNITGNENYLEQLYVAEIPEAFAVNCCEQMSLELPEMNYILRVQAVGEVEHLFGVSRQRVSIQEIYKGNGLETGQEIYIYSERWRLSLTGEYPSIERGFVNVLDSGSEYLIFAECEITVPNEEIPVFELYDDMAIAPVFCYEDKENVIAPTAGDTSYVFYQQVRDNEFFAETEDALEAWKQLKMKMLAMYPRSF